MVWAVYLWQRGGRAYLALLALALFSKENAIALPLVFVLLEWLRARRLAWEALAIGAFYMGVRVSLLGETGASWPSFSFRAALLSPVSQIASDQWTWYSIAALGPALWLIWRNRDRLLAAYFIMLLPLLLLFGTSAGRYVYPAAPFYFAWLGGRVAERRVSAVALALLSLVVGLSRLYEGFCEVKDSPFEAEAAVRALADSGPLIVLTAPGPAFYNGLCEALLLRWGNHDCAVILVAPNPVEVESDGDDWLVRAQGIVVPHANVPSTMQWLRGRHAQVRREDHATWRVRLLRKVQPCRERISDPPLWVCPLLPAEPSPASP